MAIPGFEGGGGGGYAGVTDGLKNVMQMGLQQKQMEAADQQKELQSMEINKAALELEKAQEQAKFDKTPISLDVIFKGEQSNVRKYLEEEWKKNGLIDYQQTPDGKQSGMILPGKMKLHAQNKMNILNMVGAASDGMWYDVQEKKNNIMAQIQEAKNSKKQDPKLMQQLTKQYEDILVTENGVLKAKRSHAEQMQIERMKAEAAAIYRQPQIVPEAVQNYNDTLRKIRKDYPAWNETQQQAAIERVQKGSPAFNRNSRETLAAQTKEEIIRAAGGNMYDAMSVMKERGIDPNK